MDSPANGSVTTAALVAAMNEQVLPQLSLLAHGPLAEGTAQALSAALVRGETTTAVVLQLRVLLDGRLCDVAVHAVVTPPPMPNGEAPHGDDDAPKTA